MASTSCSLMRLVISVVICLVSARPVLAKSAIGIVVTLGQQDAATNKGLRARIARDIYVQRDIASPEMVIAYQFARAFSVMKMFDFEPAGPGDVMTINILITSRSTPVWPASDAILSLSTSTVRLPDIPFVGRALC